MVIKLARYIALVLLIVWMCVIFYFSSENAANSENTSDDVIVKIAEYIYPNYQKLPVGEKQEIINKFSFPVRKLAHFTEFFVLGALSFVFFATYKKPGLILKAAVPFVFGVLYAVSDEFHQLWVSGRSGAFFDVCIDSAGVFLAVLIGFLIIYKKRGVRVG